MSLFEGPSDIIGDIHGEAGPLFQLLEILGYDGNGKHPEGRRLVFVGDMVDRGTDSITVVHFVKSLVDSGRAQAVLGNHELNILLGSRKHGNLWFWGETEAITKEAKEGPSAVSFQRLADESFRTSALTFFRSLPIALERADARVVHACWDPDAIAAVRAIPAGTDAATAASTFEPRVHELQAAAADDIGRDLARQNGNPVRVLTSGPEERAAAEFYAGGRVRSVARTRWWERYADAPLAFFGHYWRRFPVPAATPPALAAYRPAGGAELFGPTSAAAALGPRGTAACVDYSVGLRYEERGKRLPPGGLGTHLVALRLPERTLHREDGAVAPLAPPPGAEECAAVAGPGGAGGLGRKAPEL